jgi:signal transduction histidine kinase
LRKILLSGSSPAAIPLIDAMDRQLIRFEAVVDNILETSRIRAAPLSLNRKENVELPALVRHVTKRLQIELSMAGCDLQLDLAEGVRGNWDPLRLEQAILNVLKNAITYGRGRPIKVRVLASGTEAQVQIEDHGIGIGVDPRKLFLPFEKGEKVMKYPGLGLGLYITKSIVEAHAGSIRIFQRGAEGTTVTISLPLDDFSSKGSRGDSTRSPGRKAS